MDLIASIQSHLRHAASVLAVKEGLTVIPGRIMVEPSRAEDRGDFTSAIAFAFGRQTGAEPRIIAGKIADLLRDHPDFADIRVAGRGFLNLTISTSTWGRMLRAVLEAGADYGRGLQGEGARIDIGFLPADPANALPEKCPRCTVVGDAVANMLDFTGSSTGRCYRMNSEGALTIRIGQPVRLLRDGAPARTGMSLAELIDEIGNDAARFGLLIQRNCTPADLDADLVEDMSQENPLFLVQYAHARCRAIHAQAHLRLPDLAESRSWNASAVGEQGTRLILRYLSLYPGQIDQAARAGEPFRLAHYLHELAGELHTQYYRSLTAPHLRFIRDDDRLLTSARLALVRGVGTVLKSGLALLGVCAPDEIR